jgi:hypothetical protein
MPNPKLAIVIGAGGEAPRLFAINSAANQFTVERASGELAPYDPRRLTGVHVYRELEREFSIGDRILSHHRDLLREIGFLLKAVRP